MPHLTVVSQLKRIISENLLQAYSWFAYAFFPVNHVPLPVLIPWEITGKCNLRCKMCPWYGEHGTPFDTSSELTLEEIKGAIANIKSSYRFRLPYIGIIGGEPTLRQDFTEIIMELKAAGFRYALTTNFSVYDEKIISSLEKYPPSDLRISLDGPEEIHDTIRGVKGAFRNADRMIKSLRKGINGRRIPIRINCTVSPGNISHISALADYVKEIRAHFNIQHLMFLDEKRLRAHEQFFDKFFSISVPSGASPIRLKEEEVSALIGQIKLVKSKFRDRRNMLGFIPNLSIDDITPYYLDLDNYVHAKKCTYVWAAIRIDSQGNLRPCFDYRFGNIKGTKLSLLWNNEKAVHFRSLLKKKGLFPGCIRCCKI